MARAQAHDSAFRVRKRAKFRRHRTVGPSEFFQEKREFQIGFLKREGLEPQHSFLDVGCGTLRGGIPIIDLLETGKYMGIEVRPEVLAEAHKELAAAGLEFKQPELILGGDFEKLATPRRFEFAWAFSVLIHMEDHISEACVKWVGEHLTEGGRFYANANVGPTRDAMGGQGFPVLTRELGFYESHAERAGLTLTDLGTLKSLGHDFGLGGDKHHMMRFERRSLAHEERRHEA